MKRLTVLLAAAAFSFTNVDRVDAGIIQTATYNGHTYHLLGFSGWNTAENEAVSLGGHLVTINDAAENAWIASTFQSTLSSDPWPTLWIGYVRIPDTTPELTDWYWVNGEQPGFENWLTGEPRMEPTEIRSGMLVTTDPGSADVVGKWHDIYDGPLRSDGAYGLVEVGPAEVPEPASLTLFGLGALGLAAGRKRLRRHP